MCLLAGCASPGPPRAPSLHLPEPVRDLSAERFGNEVRLHWTVPLQTTDHELLAGRKHPAGSLEAELCRATVARGRCDVIARLPAVAGQPASAQDALTGPLVTGKLRPLYYRVLILNAAGHAADSYRETVSAAGQAPPEITELNATTTARGLQLTWHKEPVLAGEQLLLQVASIEAAATGQRAIAKDRNLSVRLNGEPESSGGVETGDRSPQAARPAADPGGTIDPVLHDGEHARYTVFRSVSRTLAGQPVVVNGGAATVTATRERDTFAPAVPGGLAALAVQSEGVPPEIDLSWEPDSEPDLLGYHVYRASLAGGGFQRLTTTPTAAISYRDVQVAAGARYRYAVSAIDRNGNESSRSAVVEEGLRP